MTLLKSVKKPIGRLAKVIYFIIAFLVASLIVVKAIEYLTPDFNNSFLSGKKLVFDKWYKYFFYLHIFAAPLTIFAGILQFSLNRKAKLHRLSGYVYLVAVVFASISGFFMSFKSIGGFVSGISFLILACLWIYFTARSFTEIKKGNFEKHKEFMTRSFILANSAILLRVFSFISNSYIDVDPLSAYLFNAWFSWLPWLLIYEFMLFFEQKKSNQARIL